MTYSFPAYVPILIACGAAVVALAGIVLFLRIKDWRIPRVLLLVAAFAGGIFAPSMARDRVVLDDTHLEQTTGFWFLPNITAFELDAVSSVYLTNRDDDEVWVVQFKDGSTQEFDPSDLWETNGRDIAMRLRTRGIAVTYPGL
ncbi:MAG: hypothetical protein HOP16_00905 [Acidobacteria bacterium]|nr:hypothetical protein [Acidobacteriota bacterium]